MNDYSCVTGATATHPTSVAPSKSTHTSTPPGSPGSPLGTGSYSGGSRGPTPEPDSASNSHMFTGGMLDATTKVEWLSIGTELDVDVLYEDDAKKGTSRGTVKVSVRTGDEPPKVHHYGVQGSAAGKDSTDRIQAMRTALDTKVPEVIKDSNIARTCQSLLMGMWFARDPKGNASTQQSEYHSRLVWRPCDDQASPHWLPREDVVSAPP